MSLLNADQSVKKGGEGVPSWLKVALYLLVGMGALVTAYRIGASSNEAATAALKSEKAKVVKVAFAYAKALICLLPPTPEDARANLTTLEKALASANAKLDAADKAAAERCVTEAGTFTIEGPVGISGKGSKSLPPPKRGKKK